MWERRGQGEAGPRAHNSKLICIYHKEFAHWQTYARFCKSEYFWCTVRSFPHLDIRKNLVWILHRVSLMRLWVKTYGAVQTVTWWHYLHLKLATCSLAPPSTKLCCTSPLVRVDRVGHQNWALGLHGEHRLYVHKYYPCPSHLSRMYRPLSQAGLARPVDTDLRKSSHTVLICPRSRLWGRRPVALHRRHSR